MKNLIKCFFLMVFQFGFSQMAVVDAGVNSTLASQLTTTTSQLTQLERSYDILKSSAEKVEKVSSVVKSVNSIGEIINFQKEAIANVNLVVKYGDRKNKSYTSNIKDLTSVLGSISGTISNINKVLSSGFFSMTDKERIDYFKESRSKILLNVIKTRVKANQYKKL